MINKFFYKSIILIIISILITSCGKNMKPEDFKDQKPRLIIETGVHNGVGACILSAALMRNNSEGFTGRYIGTEIDKNMGQFLKGSYKEFGSISYGDSIETLKGIDEEIDLFINDSDHSSNYEFLEYQAISNKLSESEVILGDNSHVTNSLIQFS